MELVTFHLPSSYWESVKALRWAVFVDEMNVPSELEIDKDDQFARHFAFIDKGEVVATLRILKQDQTLKIGRVAVAKSRRRQGLGTKLMHEAIQYAMVNQYRTITLAAQTYITRFYSVLGFQEQGGIFMDAGIPHIKMILHV